MLLCYFFLFMSFLLWWCYLKFKKNKEGGSSTQLYLFRQKRMTFNNHKNNRAVIRVFSLVFSYTWSSSGSSQKPGIYLAHSTSTKSCCFIDSQTSLTPAIFLTFISVLAPGLEIEIWP